MTGTLKPARQHATWTDSSGHTIMESVVALALLVTIVWGSSAMIAGITVRDQSEQFIYALAMARDVMEESLSGNDMEDTVIMDTTREIRAEQTVMRENTRAVIQVRIVANRNDRVIVTLKGFRTGG